MQAILTLILFMLFLCLIGHLITIGILVYNRIIVFQKTKQANQLVEEIKDYFKKEGIHKIGF